MEIVDEKFNLRGLSHADTRMLSFGDIRGALIATLGSDFQRVVAPFKAEIVELAQRMAGDQHRAAMRLLIDRNGRRPAAIEQQLIVAALFELQCGAVRLPGGHPLDRAAQALCGWPAKRGPAAVRGADASGSSPRARVG